MNSLTNEDLDQVQPKSTAQARWVEVHGRHQSLARTTLHSREDGELIISTAIILSSHSQSSGFGSTVETRVFGGRCEGTVSTLQIFQGDRGALERGIRQHTAVVERVGGVYLKA